MNIFVSNLSFGINDEELKGFFAEYGEVSSAKVITDKFSKRSKGYGFVEMPNDESAKKAIDTLNGASIDNRAIRVAEAKPREEGDRPARKFDNNRERRSY